MGRPIGVDYSSSGFSCKGWALRTAHSKEVTPGMIE